MGDTRDNRDELMYLAKCSDDASKTNPEVADEETWRSPRSIKGKMSSSIYKKKFIYTICLLFGNFMSGWVNGQRGPSLLDLQLITGSSFGKGSAFFTAAATGSVVGAVAGGAIYDRFNKYMSLFIAMAGHGVTVAVIPLCSQYWLMVAVFVAHEFFLGIFKTGCNVELIRVWGSESKPYMQALHFLWSLGGIISPFVLEPFLAVKVEGMTLNSTNATNVTIAPTIVTEETRIIWPFLMTGILTVISSLPFFVVFLFAREKNKTDNIEQALTSKRQGKKLTTKLLLLTLGVLGVFYFFLDEVEDSSVAFLASYVVKQLNWSKIAGARITSTFWGSYAFGRLAAIFFISYVTHTKICGLFFVLLVVSQVAMTISGTYMSGVGIWVTTCAVGFSISITFPAMLTWIEKDFFQLSGKIMSIIFVAVGFGGMVNPLIIGPLMEDYSPLWYNYVMTIESVMLLLSFIMLVVLVKKVLRKFHNAQNATERSVEASVEDTKEVPAENSKEVIPEKTRL